MSTTSVVQELKELVAANRILAHEQVLDAFGHISIRHPERPDRFFLARARSPELVNASDLMEYDLDCNPIDHRGQLMFGERPIHGAIFRTRPDVNAVIHHHAHPILPFTFMDEKLRPVFHMGGLMGKVVPAWDIRTHFGENTNLMVQTMDQGMDLARTLGQNRLVLMRRHGCVIAANTLRKAVFIAVYSADNAKLQLAARGRIDFLSDGEIEQTDVIMERPSGMNRAWEYWCRRCGLLKDEAAE